MGVVWLLADVASEYKNAIIMFCIASLSRELLESVALHIVPLPCCGQLTTVFGVI